MRPRLWMDGGSTGLIAITKNAEWRCRWLPPSAPVPQTRRQINACLAGGPALLLLCTRPVTRKWYSAIRRARADHSGVLCSSTGCIREADSCSLSAVSRVESLQPSSPWLPKTATRGIRSYAPVGNGPLLGQSSVMLLEKQCLPSLHMHIGVDVEGRPATRARLLCRRRPGDAWSRSKILRRASRSPLASKGPRNGPQATDWTWRARAER